MLLDGFTLIRISKYLVISSLIFQLIACSSGDGSGQAAGGIGALAWVAPTERADGAPMSLSEIAGYKIYYGDAAGVYPNIIDVLDKSAVELDLKSLSPGRYHFVITTVDTEGRESRFSEEVSIAL